MKAITSEVILNAYKAKNYRLKTGVLELNLFGIRNKDSQANTFDDYVGCIYREIGGGYVVMAFPATTDPGIFYRENPINVDGTAIIVPGQYLDCYQIGKHKGYPAFEQIGNIGYVRDKNKNKILDYILYLTKGNIVYGNYKTNIHYSNPIVESKNVDKWSAGCQVLSLAKNLNRILDLGNSGLSMFKYENKFDYTLFESNEI